MVKGGPEKMKRGSEVLPGHAKALTGAQAGNTFQTFKKHAPWLGVFLALSSLAAFPARRLETCFLHESTQRDSNDSMRACPVNARSYCEALFLL